MRLHKSALLLILSALVMLSAFVGSTSAQSFSTPLLVVNTSFLNVRTGPSYDYPVLTTVVGGTELPVLGIAKDNVWYQVSTSVGVGWLNIEFAIPRGDFSNVPLINVPAIDVSSTITLASPNVEVISYPSTTLPNTATTTVASPSSLPIYRVYPRGIGLNLLVSPSSSATNITTVWDEYTDYPLLGSIRSGGLEFYKIEVPNFGVGWVESTKVGLRLGRTTDYSVMLVAHNALELTLPNNTKEMLGQGTEAYLINVQGSIATLQFGDGRIGTAQVAGLVQRTNTTTDITPLQISATSSVATTTSQTPNGTTSSNNASGLASLGQGGGESATIASLTRNYLLVNISYLNARSGPGAQYTIVATLNGGTELDIIGIAGDRVWYYVQGAFGQGWVNSEYVIFRGNPDTVPIIENAYGELSTPVAAISSNITLYAAPGTNFGVIGTVVGPVEAPIVARTSDYQWVQINTSVGYGWVQTALVAVRGESSLIPIINN